ncbi:unnamed protein product [Cyclocybe aegerita]|uniref:Polyprotein n=1 Tax=Cyclocybe aegerita TaxID=1973307 RepID=A0A8S0WZD7_CYCAE|nr:unnamed protein product [Cyclocybe aegerita]
MSDSDYTTGSYRMELLKAHSWMPWKRRMLEMLIDLGLDKYIAKDAKEPESANQSAPTTAELDAQKKWREGDTKARLRIELAVSDAEMVHILGATTASEMWDQLTTVKESKGRLGVLAARHALYRATAEEGFDMAKHIAKLRQMQEELHVMGNKIPDEDFLMILITSLPESWDNYTSSFLGSSGNKPDLKSQEVVGILIEEARRRKERGDSGGVALHAKGNGKGKASLNTECFNCHKKGHLAKDCWAKGGGREGQGPKGRKGPNRAGRTHQAAEDANNSLNDTLYMANSTYTFSKYDWLLDSCTTSHIFPVREAFSDYRPLTDSPIQGVSSSPAQAKGRGTIIVNFAVEGKNVRHQLRDVLHVPEALNGLISVSRLDETGGYPIFRKGKVILKNKDDTTIGTGHTANRLYLMNARAELPGMEKANLATPTKLTWDQWHRRFGHIAISSLQKLEQEALVNGMSVDQSSIPSPLCEACIQAKQAHQAFPQEAAHRSKTPGERVMSDVWGPAGVKSIGGFKYYISFMDNTTWHSHVLFLKDKTEAFSHIKEHCMKVERQFGRYPQWMRFDNGREFVNSCVKDWAAEHGIELEPMAPYSSAQNGVAERFNHTMLELACAMLIAKNMPLFLWDDDVPTVG